MVMKQPAFFMLSQIPENCVLFFNPLQASVLRKALQFLQRQKYLRNASRFVSAVYSGSYEMICNFR